MTSHKTLPDRRKLFNSSSFQSENPADPAIDLRMFTHQPIQRCWRSLPVCPTLRISANSVLPPLSGIVRADNSETGWCRLNELSECHSMLQTEQAAAIVSRHHFALGVKV